MTTIQDIANYANVSKSTVSRVLNDSAIVDDSKRQAVLDAMAELKYQPSVLARSLAGGRSMTIGVMTQKIGSPFYDTINQGVIEGLAGTGYCPLIADGQWRNASQIEAIETLLGRKVDGLLLIGGDVSEEKLDEYRDELPVIIVGREVKGWESQSIFTNNYLAAYEVTKYLIGLGHRDIAFIQGIKDQQDATRRYEGYSAALADAEISQNPRLVYPGDFSGASGVVAINSYLSRGVNFTAVFAANDMMAFGARLALSRHGLRVPDDVSLVGFDDQAEVAFMTPPLTTVRQPAFEMGEAAAKAMLMLIDKKSVELPDFPAELQIRESAARRR